MSGCGRDTSSPKDALLGHWESEAADLYISRDKIITVLKEDGKTLENKYIIVSYNDKKRSITIKPKNSEEDITNLANVFQFNKNYTRINATIDLSESSFSESDEDTYKNIDQKYMDSQVNEIKFVDKKQEPE
ncbi:hypothetical protein [Viridibacillus arvi]|uniref:hypothetical protein n=1 Tax=Viridibacillus arvi TaxID=263475 RepID=UPI0012EE5F62|nr:hypothetical protein [Viridibacillus arvi]